LLEIAATTLSHRKHWRQAAWMWWLSGWWLTAFTLLSPPPSDPATNAPLFLPTYLLTYFVQISIKISVTISTIDKISWKPFSYAI